MIGANNTLTASSCNVILRHVIDGLEGEHGDKEEHKQLQRSGDSVRDKIADSAEDATCNADARHYRGQTVSGEHNVGSGARGVCGAIDCNADIRALERRRIVDAIAGHAAFEAHQAAGNVSSSDGHMIDRAQV